MRHCMNPSIFPSSLGKKIASPVKPTKTKKSLVKAVQAVFGDSRAVLGQEDVEAGIAVTDNLFLMEEVDSTATQLRSPQLTLGDEEREDSELDEGIHISSKFSNKKTFEDLPTLNKALSFSEKCFSCFVCGIFFIYEVPPTLRSRRNLSLRSLKLSSELASPGVSPTPGHASWYSAQGWWRRCQPPSQSTPGSRL